MKEKTVEYVIATSYEVAERIAKKILTGDSPRLYTEKWVAEKALEAYGALRDRYQVYAIAL